MFVVMFLNDLQRDLEVTDLYESTCLLSARLNLLHVLCRKAEDIADEIMNFLERRCFGRGREIDTKRIFASSHRGINMRDVCSRHLIQQRRLRFKNSLCKRLPNTALPKYRPIGSEVER